MKLKAMFILMLLFYNIASTQNIEELKSYSGKYHIMEAEYSLKFGKHTTKSKNIVIDKLNSVFKSNEKVLLITFECDSCKQSIYNYKAKESKLLGKPVFCNYKGWYMIAYDNESFVGASSEKELEGDLQSLNFYSKNKQKVTHMTKEKLRNIVSKINKNQ